MHPNCRSRLRELRILSVAFLCLAISLPAPAQLGGVVGSIVGQVRVERGGSPPQKILVNLKFRGAIINSIYTDTLGTYGFHELAPESYVVSINDDQYLPVEQTAVINGTSLAPTTYMDIILRLKESRPGSELPAKSQGANQNITDAREYSSHFPKQVRKEFEKGLAADAAGKKEEATKHYERAVQISPDYYPAHNNLGSDYLSRADFAGARKEFEDVVRLNQSDAAGYFNLSNVCMMTGQLVDAERYLEEGMRREPDSALGHFLLGALDTKNGKYPQAETALAQAIQLSPTMAQARLQLVNLFLIEKKKSQAADQLAAFIKTFPDSAFAPKARQLLQQLQSANGSAAGK